MRKEDLKILFRKYNDGTATADERALLEAWYLQHNETADIPSRNKIAAAKDLIFLKLPGNESRVIKIGYKMAAAAVLIGVLLTILFSIVGHDKHSVKQEVAADIPPGTNKATFTLNTGKQINLTDARKGDLTKQGPLTITKTQAGQVIISFHSTEIDPRPNTISTPNGGQWQVILADGTKIWLNAATALTFPSSFTGNSNRIVKLQGEAYFEVAKDAAHPFIVISGNQQIEVLGTHFNINSYNDESSVKTTLLEGSVKVSITGKNRPSILKPGQQSINDGHQIQINSVDVDKVMAWKNGYFQFDNEPINSIMRKLSRWYDVKVEYQDSIKNESLDGHVSRNKNISQVINALEATKTIHFKLEGRRITVMK